MAPHIKPLNLETPKFSPCYAYPTSMTSVGRITEDVHPWTFWDTIGTAATIVFPALAAPLLYTSFPTPLIPISGSFTAPCSLASISAIMTFPAILASCTVVALLFAFCKSMAKNYGVGC